MVVVDVNYLPGYGGCPGDEAVVLRHLVRVAAAQRGVECPRWAAAMPGCTSEAVAWAPSQAEQWKRVLAEATPLFTSSSASGVLRPTAPRRSEARPRGVRQACTWPAAGAGPLPRVASATARGGGLPVGRCAVVIAAVAGVCVATVIARSARRPTA